MRAHRAALLLLISGGPVCGRSIWNIDIDNDPDPSGRLIPAFYSNATSDRSLLPLQIVCIVAAYCGTALIIGISLLTFGRRLRRAALMALDTPTPGMRDEERKSSEGAKKTHGRSWSSLKLKRRLSKHDSGQKSPGLVTTTTFDKQVLEEDKQRRQDELEKLYTAIMTHDRPKSDEGISEEVIGDNDELDQEEAGFTRTNPPHPIVWHKHSDIDESEPDAMSTDSIHGSRVTARPPERGSEKPLPPLPPLPPPSKSALSLIVRRQSPAVSPIITSGQGSNRALNSGALPTITARTPHTPAQISSPRMFLDLEEGPSNENLPSSPRAFIQSRTTATQPATRTLPFRSMPHSLLSPGMTTKTTYLERSRDVAGPRTGLATPYSPYMPFTPMTPVTPRLLSRQELKQRQRDESKRALAEKDQVIDEKDMWGNAY